MTEHSFNPDSIFDGFEWRDNESKPDKLLLGEDGFLKDSQGRTYATRLKYAKADENTELTQTDELFHGNKPSWHNATQGKGLYVAPTPSALDGKIYIDKGAEKSPDLYILRLNISTDEILDALERDDDTTSLSQQMAKRILFAMAWVPGLAWPTPRMYDAMYGDEKYKKFISFRPSAMQRLAAKTSHITSNQGVNVKMPLRHGLIRDIAAAEIVAKKTK